ncbi:nuclease (SNase-like) protein [Prochlorococcus sp. MIT 0801]|nr:nuclease (SNase-like) protein [Prochlorococcus sp. MIT 0801]
MSKQGEEGFSLIELVVVVSVLAVLSAIAIPTFSCFQRKAQATAALAAIKQIHTECEINKSDTGNVGTFTPSNLNSYQIQSDGSNSCGGASGTGLISAIPTDTNILPTFILATNSSELTYSFKGQTGTNLTDCLGFICQTRQGNELQARIESEEFVVEGSYLERGCSAYAVVEGPTWEESESNAQKLNGHLVTLNDLEESEWIVQNIKWVHPENNTAGATAYWVGLTDADNEGDLKWADGSEVNIPVQSSDNNGSEDYFSLVDSGGLNDLTQNPGDWSMGHWQMQYGIAEISICN